MIRVLFVCHGNICRSPMAEFMFKDMVKKNGLEAEFYIESAAASSEEIGNPVYPPAKKRLAKEGIDCSGKRAVKMKKGIMAGSIIYLPWKNTISTGSSG